MYRDPESPGLYEAHKKEIVESIRLSRATYIQFLQDLLRIPTPRMREHKCVRFLGEALERCGVEVEYFQGEGLGEPTPDGPPLNLIGRRKGRGEGRSLLLQAHMDTVPPG